MQSLTSKWFLVPVTSLPMPWTLLLDLKVSQECNLPEEPLFLVACINFTVTNTGTNYITRKHYLPKAEWHF